METLTPAGDLPDPLRDLARARRLRLEADRCEALAVRRARLRGASWAVIAAALGRPRGAVRRRHRARG